MEGFIQLINNDDFKRYIINEYLVNSTMSDDEKIHEVGSSLFDFAEAMESYSLNQQNKKSN